MPGRRSKRRIGQFRKTHKSKSNAGSETTLDKSTNTDGITLIEKSTNTVCCTIEEGTDTRDNCLGDPSFVLPATSFLFMSENWHITAFADEKVRVFNLQHSESSSSLPISIARLLIVRSDSTWVCQINGLLVPASCSALSAIPDTLSVDDFSSLLTLLVNCKMCPGNSDTRFVDFCKLKKEKFLSIKKTVVAYLDKSSINSVTVRHTLCDVLVADEKRCNVCNKYRSRLRAMDSSFKKSKKEKLSTNHRFLSTPQQKIHRESLRKRIRKLSVQNQHLKSQLSSATESRGVCMDALLESDLMAIVNGTKTPVEGLPDNDFRKVFWEQQVTALSKRGTQAVRWHPFFVRWCLNVMLSSPKTYNIIRDSGMLVLSSQRTLKDYSNWFKAKLGYQSEVFQQLAEDYKVFELKMLKGMLC